jgi:hypothetical protein
MAPCELRAHGVPQQLHQLDARLCAVVVRASNVEIDIAAYFRHRRRRPRVKGSRREKLRGARGRSRAIATARNVMRETGLSTEAWFLLRRRLGLCPCAREGLRLTHSIWKPALVACVVVAMTRRAPNRSTTQRRESRAPPTASRTSPLPHHGLPTEGLISPACGDGRRRVPAHRAAAGTRRSDASF